MKRGIIIFIFVSIFILIGSGIYALIKPQSTCSDGKKNQGEAGVDCGGPCTACQSAIHAEDLETEEAFLVYGGIKKYDLGAKIKNPNVEYGAINFQYTFVLKNTAGKDIAQQSGSSFILPGESKFVIENNVESEEVPDKIELRIENPQWRTFSRFQTPQFGVYSKHYSELNRLEAFSEVTGIVRNENPEDYQAVEVAIILRNQEGVPVALTSTRIQSMMSQQERGFRVTWPQSFPGEVAQMDVQISTNVLDPDNLVRP